MSLFLILVLSFVTIIHIAEAGIHSMISNIFILDTREEESISLEDSALSNIFMLDTRKVPLKKELKHSGLSNIFTLDTRKVKPEVIKNCQ
jgi:hypothetical protein